MLSDNDVGVMTSSLTSTSALSVRQPSRKGEDVCEIRTSLFCAPRRYHYSNDTVSISLDCLFHRETVQIAATGRRSFIVSLFLFHWCMCVRLFLALHHASFWRLVIFHGKTAQRSMGYAYVFESVDHLTADNTLEKNLRRKIVYKLDILHSHNGYNIMAYHVVTSYQWRDVTNRPPTVKSETVTVIPISYAFTAIFGLIPHSNNVSNEWRI